MNEFRQAENAITPMEYGKKACDILMKCYKAAELPPYDANRKPPLGLFSYHQGVFLSGMNRIYQKCGEEKYFAYIKDWVDSVLSPDGKIIEFGGWVSLDTLDFRQAGILMFPIFQKTGDKKYMKIVQYLVESLEEFPKNNAGGFWHMREQANQMWLDGLYMAGPICAMYADYSGKTRFFDIAAEQTIIMWDNMHDESTGLMRHAWDASKEAEWADKKTGLSPEVWGRALGWFVTAAVDILDYLPRTHEKRQQMIEIVKQALGAVVSYQDKSGRWYQVVDKTDEPGNWLENSCSCLFVYALAKAVKKGYLDQSFKEYAVRGFQGVIDSLAWSEDGELLIQDVCVGTCVGDYSYYCARETVVNDLHGTGAFVLMCSELEI